MSAEHFKVNTVIYIYNWRRNFFRIKKDYLPKLLQLYIKEKIYYIYIFTVESVISFLDRIACTHNLRRNIHKHAIEMQHLIVKKVAYTSSWKTNFIRKKKLFVLKFIWTLIVKFFEHLKNMSLNKVRSRLLIVFKFNL